MKTVSFFLILYLSSFFLIAQEFSITSRTSTRIDLEGKVFNKITGEQITNSELMELLKEKPGLEMEHFFDEYGNFEKAFYDPKNPFKSYKRDPNLRPKVGEVFPKYIFKTIEEEEFESDHLIGKWVIIHFQPLTQFIQKDQWNKLVLDLRKANQTIEIECFGIFPYNEDLIESVGEFQPDIKLVNGGRGFYERYHIIENPTTVLINPDGIVIQYFYGNEQIDFLRFLEN